ncbi:MAG: hypothetical protein M3077_14505 [Candidatus Dormibacteraeota bacterium]|nr:hypothetical protein [Candidatus Dormibacteraeota bacterium]
MLAEIAPNGGWVAPYVILGLIALIFVVAFVCSAMRDANLLNDLRREVVAQTQIPTTPTRLSTTVRIDPRSVWLIRNFGGEVFARRWEQGTLTLSEGQLSFDGPARSLRVHIADIVRMVPIDTGGGIARSYLNTGAVMHIALRDGSRLSFDFARADVPMFDARLNRQWWMIAIGESALAMDSPLAATLRRPTPTGSAPVSGAWMAAVLAGIYTLGAIGPSGQGHRIAGLIALAAMLGTAAAAIWASVSRSQQALTPLLVIQVASSVAALGAITVAFGPSPIRFLLNLALWTAALLLTARALPIFRPARSRA